MYAIKTIFKLLQLKIKNDKITVYYLHKSNGVLGNLFVIETQISNNNLRYRGKFMSKIIERIEKIREINKQHKLVILVGAEYPRIPAYAHGGN